ncbi:MAG TPA: PP2C family serine/threonine-protein phosphatase [Edaphobacter sp.]|nr:PP2C family serine/threonine-protein phosphatase [Edaphobacter sp.]
MSANHLIYAMLTHRGRVRHGNEDTCAASPEAGAYVVCDGMGGAAAGEIASNLAADTFLAHLTPPPRGAEPVKPQARLNAAIQAANQAVYQQSRQSAKLAGMGTTLVALLHAPILNGKNVKRRTASDHTNSRVTDPPTLWLGHVGDSRCYRRRRGKLEQLTHDHSLVEEQLRAGQITAAQAAHSPMRNLITRAIGSQATVEAEIQSHRPQPNDIYLLASDGLTHEVEDEEISTILAAIPKPPTARSLTAACEALITAANRNGGRDNITVLLVAVTPDLAPA